MDIIVLDMAEWAVFHLMDRKMRDSFGMSNDPAKSKNTGARAAICLVRSAIEILNKSDQLIALFLETFKQELGYDLRQKAMLHIVWDRMSWC